MWPFKKKKKSRKGTDIKGLSKSNLKDIEIKRGHHKINVEGTGWCKISLSDCEDKVLSLTPRNEYQKEHEWPAPGCVNVNANGAKRTTGKNWVGYIPPKKAKKLNKIVMNHGITRVHARVEGNNVTLLVPRRYK